MSKPAFTEFRAIFGFESKWLKIFIGLHQSVIIKWSKKIIIACNNYIKYQSNEIIRTDHKTYVACVLSSPLLPCRKKYMNVCRSNDNRQIRRRVIWFEAIKRLIFFPFSLSISLGLWKSNLWKKKKETFSNRILSHRHRQSAIIILCTHKNVCFSDLLDQWMDQIIRWSPLFGGSLFDIDFVVYYFENGKWTKENNSNSIWARVWNNIVDECITCINLRENTKYGRSAMITFKCAGS